MDQTVISNNPETPPMSYRQLLAVLIGLIALTGLTVFVAQIDLGALNIFAALLIATGKATLVTLFFMHLNHESSLIRRTFLCTLIILSVSIGLMLVDLIFR